MPPWAPLLLEAPASALLPPAAPAAAAVLTRTSAIGKHVFWSRCGPIWSHHSRIIADGVMLTVYSSQTGA